MKRIRRGHAVSMTSFSSLSLCTHFEYLIYYFPESASQKKLIGLKISKFHFSKQICGTFTVSLRCGCGREVGLEPDLDNKSIIEN